MRQREITAEEANARRRWDESLRWAERNLPSEDPNLAAMAKTMLERLGGAATPATVKSRLVEQGRDMATLGRFKP